MNEQTLEERQALVKHFTDIDGPVFALTNLDETVKGALFARYSRSPKGLRRLWLDEFRNEEDELRNYAGSSSKRATELYKRVLGEYGDDSVAQLGSAHVACEGISNVLTKVVERGRLMSYLEQSTRYIPYTRKVAGRWRYLTPPEIVGTGNQTPYERAMDHLFQTYTTLLPRAEKHYRKLHARAADEKEQAYDRAIRARALDTVRGLLPAATRSNVGIHGSGQAFEGLVLRLLSHPLKEAQECGTEVLKALKEVIPSFVQRIERPERGGAWIEYLQEQSSQATRIHKELDRIETADGHDEEEVRLVNWDEDAEARVLAAAARSGGTTPLHMLLKKARAMNRTYREALLEDYGSKRSNRRHRPGRALEEAVYTFEVTADYGAFRDLQRHRMLTMEWEQLGISHGHVIPEAVDEMGAQSEWEDAIGQAEDAWRRLEELGTAIAQYAVPMACRIRFAITLNAREAMHMIELRTQPAGHPSYRRVCQRMHTLIREVAGHRAIANMMRFANHDDVQLGRLQAEQRSQKKREANGER